MLHLAEILRARCFVTRLCAPMNAVMDNLRWSNWLPVSPTSAEPSKRPGGDGQESERWHDLASQSGRALRRPLLQSLLSGLVLAATVGCQHYARITWDSPEPVSVGEKTPLAVDDLAEIKRAGGIWDRRPSDAVIGKHTFTVFAIPVGSINTHKSTPLKKSFAAAVREALEASGYELIPADKADPEAPVLRGEVNACWWWSYNYFWPVVVQGGRNKVTLVLETRDGNPLWKREFTRIAPGVTPGGAFAFDLMIKWSMTKLVRDIVRECSSHEFKAALANGGAATQIASR